MMGTEGRCVGDEHGARGPPRLSGQCGHGAVPAGTAGGANEIVDLPSAYRGLGDSRSLTVEE
jgi:hypothetical protein